MTAAHLIIIIQKKRSYFRRCKLNGWREAETWEWALNSSLYVQMARLSRFQRNNSCCFYNKSNWTQLQKQLQMIKQDGAQLKNFIRCRDSRDIVVLTVPFHHQILNLNTGFLWRSSRTSFKEIVHTKMKIYQKRTHPQVIQDVDEFFFFIWTDLEKCSITSLAHH